MSRFKGVVQIEVDLDMLRKQKQALVDAHDPGDKRDESLAGLVYLLDDIQDQIAEQTSEQEVFGNLNKEN